MAEEVYKPKFVDDNNIKTDVITLYQIKVNGKVIGHLQDLNISERRDVYEVWGIGMQQTHAVPDELIPGLVKTKTLSASMVAFYNQNVFQALGFDTLTLLEAETPFEIVENKYDPKSKEYKAYRTYKDCIIADFGSTRTITGDIRIVEKVTIHYRDVVIGSNYPSNVNEKSSS